MSHQTTITVRLSLEEAAAVAEAAKAAKRSLSAQCAYILAEFIKDAEKKEPKQLELPIGE